MFPELFLVKASPPLLCKYSTNSGKFPAPDRLRTCSKYDYQKNYGALASWLGKIQPTGIQTFEMVLSWLTVVTKCSSEEFVNPEIH